MPKRPPILRRRPSLTFALTACDDATAWDQLTLLIKCGQQAGVTSATVRVREGQ